MEALFKLARRQNEGEEEDSCPTNFDDLSQADNIVGDVTLHQLMTYVSLGCMVVTLVIGGYLTFGQVFNYREPRVQKHLIRIILTAPVFAVLCFIGVAAYGSTHYVEAIAEFYEVFTLHAIFLLMVALLVPSTSWDTQIAFFSNPKFDGFKTFKRRYIFVMQLIPVRLICLIATLIMTAVECWMDSSWRSFAGIVTVIEAISLVLAISGLAPFMLRNTVHVRKIDPQVINKILSVKFLVLARLILTLVLSILVWTDTLEPTDTASYNDLNVGVSVFGTCILAMFTGLLMLPFYSRNQFVRRPLVDLPGEETGYAPRTAIEYDEEGNAKIGQQLIRPELKPQASPFKALLDVLNIVDVFRAVWRGIKLIGRKEGYAPAPQTEQTELPEYSRRAQ